MKRTIVAFLLDETGSMIPYRDETISGFNEYVDTLRRNGSKKVKFTLTKFNSQKIETLYNAVSLSEVTPLGHTSYKPNWMTPLYDALVQTIRETERTLDNKKKKHRVLFVIMTDGEENNSETTREQAFDLIKEKEEDGWTFVFLGANQDSWQAGVKGLGMSAGNVANYDQAQTTGAFRHAAMASVSYLHSDKTMTDSFWDDADIDDGDDAVELVQ